MRRMTTTVAAAMLVLAACSSDGAPRQVASLGGAGATTATRDKAKPASPEELQAAFISYARCMREQGIDMPDPNFSGEGGAALFGVSADGSSVDLQKLDAANKACEPLIAGVVPEVGSIDPAELERGREEALKFARCMREQGIDMPDPEIDDRGGLAINIGDPSEPRFQAAMKKCGSGEFGVFGAAGTPLGK